MCIFAQDFNGEIVKRYTCSVVENVRNFQGQRCVMVRVYAWAVILHLSLRFFSRPSTLVTVIGIRAYTSDKSWAAFFDYHGGFESLSGINVGRHTIVAGASYKDLDFGAGIGYASLGEYSGTGLSITLGYNIRCYKHR